MKTQTILSVIIALIGGALIDLTNLLIMGVILISFGIIGAIFVPMINYLNGNNK